MALQVVKYVAPSIVNTVKRQQTVYEFLHRTQCFNLTRIDRHLSVVVPYPDNNFASYVKIKFNNVVQWYEEFTGMDEVRMSQNRVLQAEECFKQAQENRREISHSLSAIQTKLKDLHAELDGTTRGEDRYIQIITQEHKLLKEERAVQDKFKMAERDERDYFAALSSSVKESHEKERAQAERTKYWSIIGSIVGTVIGIIGTLFNNHLRMNELKKLITTSANAETIAALADNLKSNDNKLGTLSDQLKNITISPTYTKIENSLDIVQSKLFAIESGLKNMGNSKIVQVVSSVDDSELLEMPFVNLNDAVFMEHKKTRIIIVAAALLSVLMPIVMNKWS